MAIRQADCSERLRGRTAVATRRTAGGIAGVATKGVGATGGRSERGGEGRDNGGGGGVGGGGRGGRGSEEGGSTKEGPSAQLSRALAGLGGSRPL
ncbi:hypothetical protein RRF57_001319 [Xylaria bambusicola]|uniref:Uncharacterized protein n=1 Tax=Xylaria bambusicola TaxID=326684 RepID=A0AAN7UDN1_9PEZI